MANVSVTYHSGLFEELVGMLGVFLDPLSAVAKVADAGGVDILVRFDRVDRRMYPDVAGGIVARMEWDDERVATLHEDAKDGRIAVEPPGRYIHGEDRRRYFTKMEETVPMLVELLLPVVAGKKNHLAAIERGLEGLLEKKSVKIPTPAA